MENKVIDMDKYDGKLYLRTNDPRTELGLCLKFKYGSFHFNDELVKVAQNIGWSVYYAQKTYSTMPWGSQHTGYKYVQI